MRRGWLRPGACGTFHWTQDGESAGSMGYQVREGAVELRYSIISDEGERTPVHITIPVHRVPCRFGGERCYWQCPRCYRRCEVVVMATHGQSWGCRRCFRLRYLSQRLAPGDRLQRRADQFYARAGIESEDGAFIHKHKWMRWKTFDRLIDRANAASNTADAVFLYRLSRLGFFSEADALAKLLGSDTE